MKVLVIGASGATGRLVVEQLLSGGVAVTAVTRSTSHLPNTITEHKNITLVSANLLELSDVDIENLIENCEAIISCLGHNLSLKGIYGQPRRLVTDAVKRFCNVVKYKNKVSPVKFILMNTTGNSNRDIPETVSFMESCLIGLIRLLLPPHVDNEQAADFLRTEIGSKDSQLEWVVIRPDTLINKTEVSEYELYPSPIRSAIFNAGETSRINVAHFMGALVLDRPLWQQWKGRMPVIYNKPD